MRRILPGMEQLGGLGAVQTMDHASVLAELAAQLPRRRWSGKRIVTAGLLALVVLGLAVGLYAFNRQAMPLNATPTYVDVPEIMVNLRTSDDDARFLKVRLVIEAATPDAAAAIKSRLPGVMDGFHSFLRELRPQDLAGASGTYRIKEELLIRVNQAAAPARASDVLVQEMIQQ